MVQRLASSGVWDEMVDAMAEVVQVGAIGVVKHLCNANGNYFLPIFLHSICAICPVFIDGLHSVENTFALVLPAPGQAPASTGLSKILALVRRSESIPVKSEGTRVLVNVVKSLWSNSSAVNPSSSIPSPTVNGRQTDRAVQDEQTKMQEAMRVVLTYECAYALASLVGRSGKYPLLVNEGVVALSLLSTHREGGKSNHYI